MTTPSSTTMIETAVSAMPSPPSAVESRPVEPAKISDIPSNETLSGPKILPPIADVSELKTDDEGRSSFRENPLVGLLDYAENPLEAMLLKMASHSYGHALEMIRVADRTYDPVYKMKFVEFAMKIDRHVLEIHTKFQDGRRKGRQEVVVSHQTVAVPRERRRNQRTTNSDAASRPSSAEGRRA